MSTEEQGGWRDSARKAAAAALGLYERDSVEYELALYLSRALRELDNLEGK